MKASPNAQLQLLELARLDAQRARLEHTAKNLPEQHHLLQLKDERSTRRAELVRLTGVVEDSEAELRRQQSDVELVEQRLKRDEARLAASTSVTDVQGLEREIATLKKRRSDLEDIELELMARLERERAELTDAREQRNAVEQQADELTELRDRAVEHLQQEAKTNALARREVLKQLPQDVIELYESCRGRGGVGAAELVGAVTMATGVTLDHVDLTRIAAAPADDIVMCPDSGAILVRTERSARS